MKKITYILFFISIISNAQIIKINPYSCLKYNELGKAKEGIDQFVNHPKTKKDSRTWWLRGQIYQAIHSSDEFKYLSDSAIVISFHSYIKALVYNFRDNQLQNLDIENNKDDLKSFKEALKNKKTKYTNQEIIIDILGNIFPVISDTLVNLGIFEYKKTKNFNKAVSYFEKSLLISEIIDKVDTELIYYNVFACQKAMQYILSNYYIEKLIAYKYGDDKTQADLFVLQSRNYKSIGDTATCLKVLNKGIKKYPKELTLKYEKINYLIEQEKNRKARKQIKNTSPTDSVKMYYMYYDMAVLYEQTGNIKKAEEYYLHSLEINTNYFNSNYNLGALYFNQATDIYNNAINIPVEKNNKYNEQINKAKSLFKKSLPYFIKANEIDKNDVYTKKALSVIYDRLGFGIKNGNSP